MSGSILDVLTGEAGSAESSSNIMETFSDSTRDGRHGSPSFPSSYIPSHLCLFLAELARNDLCIICLQNLFDGVKPR